MRNKGHKVTSREETLRNFTREFLIEEKRRCEVDRYISDFRVLIHKKPHENHNYLNRLLQDYTSMFLSHERISENKSNEDEKKYQLKKQLASKMKNSPKKRYVKSKLSKTDERQSYSVLKAETADFLRKLRAYEELEQIAYEIFFKLSQNNRISRNINATGGKMYKTSAVPEEIPYKKHYRNVYIVNDPTKSSEIKLNKPISQNGETKKILSNKQSEKNPLENFEYIKNETIAFMKNNRDHNDAERKILFEQYQTNKYIQKYVDSLTSTEKQKAEPSSPKKGIFYKIKNMIGLSPDNTSKFYINVENENQIGNTKIFLETERKYSNAEFEAYKLFYIKHGELPNPLLENIKEIAYNDNVFVNNESANSGGSKKKIKIKHFIGSKNNTLEISPEKEEFEHFNVIKCSPTEHTPTFSKNVEQIKFKFEENLPPVSPNKNKTQSGVEPIIISEKTQKTMVNVENNSKLDDEKLKMLREQTREFLYQQRLYSDQQKQFYDNFIANHPLQPYENVKKESFLTKIKHLFKFGKGDKGKEKNLYFKEITAEFLRNEQYYNNQTYFHNNRIHLHQQQLISKIGKMKDEFPINDDVNRNKSQTLVQESRQRSKLAQHQRSRSEDLLMFKEKAKSLEPKSKKSPTGHKTFSNRLKSMVGIGNRRRTKSRDSLTHLTNPVQYFLDHERFNYDIDPEISRKYCRSKSTLDEPDSNGTMRKKTKRFFSTENILHHDQNDKVSNKPPSGRSRKEKRSDEKSDKRRSRTLSPAQKLVSKFKGILNKDAKKTEKDRENWENFMKENKIFMLDHKRFNDSLMQKTLLSSPKTLNKETLISPDRKSVEDPSFFEQNITTTKSKQNENIKPQQIEKPKRSKVEIEAKQPKTHQKSNHEIITKPSEINKVSKLGEGKNIFDDPQFVKSQTRIFLHDAKKYHDMDKEPNCIDKTLIFVNNKASPSLDTNGILRLSTESSEKLSKTEKNSINNLKDKKEELDPVKLSLKNVIEEKSSTSTETSEDIKEMKNMKNVEKTEKAIFSTNTTEIKTTQKTIRKEIRTTSQKVFTETYQKKSVTDCLPTHNHHLIKDQNIPIKSSKNTEKLKQNSIKKEISKEKIPSLDRKIDLSSNLYKDKARDIHNEESFKLLLKQTEDFLKNQVYSVDKNTNPNETISVVSPFSKDEQTMKDKISQTSTEKTFVRNIPLKKHQDCHEQKNEQNDFHKEAEKLDPKTLISPKMGESKTIITKVKNVLSPHRPRKAESPLSSQQPLKSNDLEEEAINRFLRSQNEEFLSKHKYHIHKEEVDFNKSPLSTKLLTREKTIVPQSIVKKDKKDVEVQENETSKEHPMKGGKQKKSAFSKIKSLMSGTKTTDKDNALLKKQTQEFLSNLREYDDNQKETYKKFRIIWLSDQKLNVEEIRSPKHMTSVSKPIDKEYDHKMFLLRKQQTESFLKDHQNYHIQQMKEHSDFLKRTGKHDHEIWLAPALPASDVKKGKSILSKVKNLLTTQQPGKEKGLPIAMSYPYLKDETEEFLRKHQYLIHKEEIDFKSHNIEIKSKVPNEIVLSKTMSPEQMVSPKSKSKNISLSGDDKKERSIISRIKSSITGTIDQDLMKKQNDQLRNQTKEFLDDIKKYDHMERDAWSKYKVLWLNEQTKNIKGNIAEKSVVKKHDHKMFLLVLQQTNSFLEDHKDYHNKQRSGYNDFLHKAGKPERDIWISSKMKEKQNIITKVKNLLSPQQRLKQNDPEQEERHRFLKSQTEEFLRKHRYLIHKEEVDFKKLPLSTKSVINEATVVSQTITKEEVVPQKKEIFKEHPIKEEKQKKSTFSKIKSLMSGTRNTDSFNKDNELLRKYTQEFLNHLRQYDENEKEACKKFRVTWLNDQKSNEKEIRISKPITSAPTSIDKEYDHKMFLLLKQQTESFLKDHQDYHIQQTKEHNEFLKKSGKHYQEIWLSSAPPSSNMKKGKNIMKRVKNLLTTQQPIKEKNLSEIKSSPYLKDETEEFLRKHQYLIHKEETVFKTPNIAIETKASKEIVLSKTMSPEQTVNHQSKTKIIPSSRDDKNKKGIISKIKSSFSGTTDSDSMKIQNEQLRKQTKEFLDDTRKYDDVEREAWSKYKVIWLKDQTKNIEGNMKNKSTNMTEKPVVEEHDYKMYLLVLQKTNSFLEDHKDYHNKQRAEYNDFLQKAGIPERDIWISTKMKEKKNIITKVKNLLSPQQRLKPKDSEEDKIQQFLKDQSEEFLRKHQYLIHKEEVDFKKLPLSTKSVINEETIVSQTITKEEVVPQKKEIFKEHPIKEGKQKKSTFSKIKSLMSGTKNTDSVTLVAEKENELLKEKTREFLNNLRKYDDQEKNIWSKTKIIWLNENKICNSYKRECSPTEINEDSSVDNYFGYDISNFIKEQNISFLQNHQDYHNKQKDEHNVFLHKMKKPDHEIWLSSKTKESRNIITKVKNLLSPKQSHKRKPPKTEENNIYLKKQTDEFLRQHQYLIHRDETEFKADPAVQKIDTQKIIVKEKSPMHTTGIKCSTNNQTFNLDPKINSSIAIELFSNEQDHNKFLLILQQTDSFLKNHKNYHNQQRMEDIAFLKKAGREKHEIWLASKEKSVKETVMSKVKNIFHSPKPVPESAIFYDDIDETEKHLQDQQNKIEPSNLNNSTKANNILTPELDLTKVVHTTRKKSPNMDETETPKKKANNSLKNTEKQNESQKNRLDRDIISHQQNPQVSKKKVTFIEEQSSQNSQTYDDDIANYQILMQQTKQFLQDHKYYHDQQREQPINEKKTEENLQNKASFPIKKLSHSSTCSKNVNTSSKKNSTPTMIKEAPTIPPRKIKLTSQTIYSDSDMNRSKIINSDEYMRADDKNMFELTKGQTKQFLQEHQYVIHKEEISQNKMKPTPFPRKSERTVTSSKHDLDKAGKTDNEDYALRRENLVLFLKNHQDYHDKERNEFIDFATEKVKNPKGVTEKSPTSEPKSKSTFMTKLKSFVSGSSQNSSPDKDWKRENDLLRKQTLEFLISQKCYNDLEGAANLNFVNMSKLLKPQSRSIDSKNTGGFNFSRKRLEEESPKKMVEEGQNTNPQVSSINEKKVQKEIATNVNSISKIIELDNSVSIRKQNQDFLDSQIHYINSENNTWKNYVKFRPEVAVLKKTYPQNEKVHSTKKVYIKPQTNTQIRKPSSQVESEKIDYEILLHKTKTFLEDSQNYTSLQHREFIEFVPKALPPVKTDMESKTEERKDGVLSKIKSFLPSSQSKNKSYDLLKAKQSSQTDSKPTETMPTLKKISQPIDIQDASNSHEVTLKEQTDLFLKDHQDYHDKQRTAIMQHFGNYEDYSAKQNKSKKGIMHKFISLVGGEQSKKKVSKKSADNNHSQKEEVKKPDESFDRKQIFEVRELDASPTTYKKMRFPPKEDQEVETVSESEKLEKMASENNSENVTKVKEDSVSLNSTVTTSILSESSRCNLHEKTSHGLQTSAVNTTLDTKQKIVFEDSRKASISKDSTITKLSDVQPHINHNERKNYVKAKIQTQDFLLSQKRFCDSNYIEIDASESQKIITKPPISEKLSIRSSRIANNTEKNPMNTTEEDLKTKKQESKKEPRKSLLLPSAPTLHQIEGSDKRNESVLIQRVVSPLSPKKTIFKEIRSRESSPDRRIYILSEGYTITKEPKPNFDKFNNYTERNGSELHPSETSRQMKNRKPANQDSENQEHFQYKPEISFEKNQEEQKKEMKKFEENLVITEPNDSKLFLDGERDHAMMQTKTDELLTEHSEGQNCSSRSEFLPSPSQHSSQGDSVRIRQTKRRTYREMENEPLSVITETRIEINGSNTQRYTTSCYFHQVPTPVWYTESLLIDMEEKSQKLNEKVYYDNKFRPTHWSETYLTDVIPKTDMFTSEVTIPILHESEAIHYISLEPQQKKTEELENV